MSYLEQNDAAIFDLIRQEEIRQKDKIRLIASENYVSSAVLAATGRRFGVAMRLVKRIPAGGGLGGGSSWVDTNCKLLKNSRELWNMGMKAAALALMCNDPANKEALELTGFICPQTEKHKESAVDKNYEPVTIKKAYYE